MLELDAIKFLIELKSAESVKENTLAKYNGKKNWNAIAHIESFNQGKLFD